MAKKIVKKKVPVKKRPVPKKARKRPLPKMPAPRRAPRPRPVSPRRRPIRPGRPVPPAPTPLFIRRTARAVAVPFKVTGKAVAKTFVGTRRLVRAGRLRFHEQRAHATEMHRLGIKPRIIGIEKEIAGAWTKTGKHLRQREIDSLKIREKQLAARKKAHEEQLKLLQRRYLRRPI